MRSSVQKREGKSQIHVRDARTVHRRAYRAHVQQGTSVPFWGCHKYFSAYVDSDDHVTGKKKNDGFKDRIIFMGEIKKRLLYVITLSHEILCMHGLHTGKAGLVHCPSLWPIADYWGQCNGNYTSKVRNNYVITAHNTKHCTFLVRDVTAGTNNLVRQKQIILYGRNK